MWTQTGVNTATAGAGAWGEWVGPELQLQAEGGLVPKVRAGPCHSNFTQGAAASPQALCSFFSEWAGALVGR